MVKVFGVAPKLMCLAAQGDAGAFELLDHLGVASGDGGLGFLSCEEELDLSLQIGDHADQRLDHRSLAGLQGREITHKLHDRREVLAERRRRDAPMKCVVRGHLPNR